MHLSVPPVRISATVPAQPAEPARSQPGSGRLRLCQVTLYTAVREKWRDAIFPLSGRGGGEQATTSTASSTVSGAGSATLVRVTAGSSPRYPFRPDSTLCTLGPPCLSRDIRPRFSSLFSRGGRGAVRCGLEANSSAGLAWLAWPIRAEPVVVVTSRRVTFGFTWTVPLGHVRLPPERQAVSTGPSVTLQQNDSDTPPLSRDHQLSTPSPVDGRDGSDKGGCGGEGESFSPAFCPLQKAGQRPGTGKMHCISLQLPL